MATKAAFFSLFTCTVGLAALALQAGPAYAASPDEERIYQQKLDELHDSISRVQAYLRKTHIKRGSTLTELQDLERSISTVSRALKKTKKQLKILAKKLVSLSAELVNLNQSLAQQRILLSNQVRSAYMLGSQPEIKMLLNQQDPVQAGRTMTYFAYLNRARGDQIEDFINDIASKKRLEADIESAIVKQERLQVEIQGQSRALVKKRQQRKHLLVRLNQDIQNQEDNLSYLEASRHRIEELLMSVGELLADIPSTPGDVNPFASLKGKLPWPLSGKLVNHYGQIRNQGGLRWKGVVITAKHGTPVRSVSYGRIAFADWLQGFGFITIIDHNEGYMSLYGHNETLFKQAGDWVEAGEVIATSGDSGGQLQSGLYFEIRVRGKPVNPSAWCSDQARYASTIER